MTDKRTTVQILAEGLVFALKVLVVLISTIMGVYLAVDGESPSGRLARVVASESVDALLVRGVTS